MLSPLPANAGVISNFASKIIAIFVPDTNAAETEDSATSQTMPLFKSTTVNPQIDEDSGASDGESDTKDALQATAGPLRVSTEDIDYPTSDTISLYEVKKGDTLSTVADLFGVSKNTIIWANDLNSQTLNLGDTLIILPMTGIRHTVKKGDTISTIAKKYKADADDIAKFNGIAADATLSIGDIILVPEGELEVTTVTKTKSGSLVTTEKLLNTYAYTTPPGFLIRPIVGGRKTQGLHGHNGVDLGAPRGTTVMASASGRIIVAKSSGYNGGYGSMIVIEHDGGIQTVYAHLQAVYVSPGMTVSQGQAIGAVGNTGRSTGPHLHFEVRGAKNPF